MKTRIVYPRYWNDVKFANTNIITKALFGYLINNERLGLSRYLRITDRQIQFDTGLNNDQLAKAKQELQEIKWCFFSDEWVYHNHDAAYVDYEGRDRVLLSKEKEIEQVPQEIKDLFKGLTTGFKPVLNHKSKTINPKPKIEEILSDEFCKETSNQYSVSEKSVKYLREDLILYCKSRGKTYKDYRATLQNWVRRALKQGEIKKQVKTTLPNLPEISDSQRAENMRILEGLRKQVGRTL